VGGAGGGGGPVPSPRTHPIASPRSQPTAQIPSSPHTHQTPTHSPHPSMSVGADGGPSEMMLSQLAQQTGAHPPMPLQSPQQMGGMGGPGGVDQGQDNTPMTPQDQLSKYVEQL
jgi:E1A/CREB-binding protein